jgi:hypothetical protein
VALGGEVEVTLGAAIVSALKDPKGLRKTLKRFSAPVLAKQYTGLYRRLIASSIPSRNSMVATSINRAASERLPL